MFTFHPTERISPDDLMSLAAERGSTPMQVGAVMMLDAPKSPDPGLVKDAIARRIAAVPRLRQRLVKVPWGCGRPVWVDDYDFTITNHFSVTQCPAPFGESAVLAVAAETLLTRLPHDRPLWAAKLVTDTDHGKTPRPRSWRSRNAAGIVGRGYSHGQADSAGCLDRIAGPFLSAVGGCGTLPMVH